MKRSKVKAILNFLLLGSFVVVGSYLLVVGGSAEVYAGVVLLLYVYNEIVKSDCRRMVEAELSRRYHYH